MRPHPTIRSRDTSRSEDVRRLCLAADIEQYSRLDSPGQRTAQDRLARATWAAAERSGLDHSRWSVQPQGDLVFAVLPPGTPEHVVLSEFATHLAAELGGYNATCRPTERMRLRLAIDTGVAAAAALGFSGPAPIAVIRYLDAPEVKLALAAAESANLIVVVSDRLYQDVVRSRLHGLDPGQYRRIHVQQKEFAGYGWVWLPGTNPASDQELTPNRPDGEPKPGPQPAEGEKPSFVQYGVHGTAIQGVVHGSVVYGSVIGGAGR